MLVLTRREKEAVILTVDLSSYLANAGNIEPLTMSVEILNIRGNQVQVGISAPDVVNIARDECL